MTNATTVFNEEGLYEVREGETVILIADQGATREYKVEKIENDGSIILLPCKHHKADSPEE